MDGNAVAAIRHQDARVNIPTEELRDFVEEDEAAPSTLLYPRDPSLDPQLVWNGKDEQDREDLAVPSVPIYVQEKIHPQALIEDLRRQARGEAERQVNLFADFEDLPFEEMVEFYRHEQNWANRMILGDALLVMGSLAEKERLHGQVQMIYVDPPYGIKFNSNWQVSTRKPKVQDGKTQDLTRQPEQVKAFRDTWELGIHSYLNYLRERLIVARELLTTSGSIFVQIGDENVHLVRSLLDEVFGPENFVSLIPFKKTSAVGSFAGGTTVLAGTCDYIVWFAKNADQIKYRQLYRSKDLEGDGGGAYRSIEEPDGTRRPATPQERRTGQSSGRFFRPSPMTSDMVRENQTTVFPVHLDGQVLYPGNKGWKTNREGMDRLLHARRLMVSGTSLAYVRYLDDFPAFPLTNLWSDTQSGSGMEKIYVVQTNTKVVERCLLMTTDPGDLVLDPTCGSGTTAFVAEQWGRRWITIDTSRVALALARTRLMAGQFPYYLLADSPEGVRREAELTGQTPPDYRTEGDIKKAFVYRRVPHVTLKSVANNPEIRDGMSREQIRVAISRRADTEILYDQPFEDHQRVRVSGPFTVESLSPHRVLSVDRDGQDHHERPCDGVKQDITDFVRLIVDNLKKAGVQNTVRGERLAFDRLEPHAGEWIQAAGEYTEYAGDNSAQPVIKRVAVCVGPEHGTVGPDMVKDAAKEAVRGLGFDLLVVCGFAFDPHVSEEAKRYGRLAVLPARMNADLMMGDALKATGAGNLFTVFGEPDVEITKGTDGTLTVTIKGLDVYDPRTGEVRSNATDEIACWFVDTAYDEQQFVVRHAYFTGGNQPFDRLQSAKALKAEVDEAAWASLYATTSRPFEPPKTGRIAVKVINHYGDEVLKVYPVT